MKLVVVGGQSRNLGKTSLVCDIVCALADGRWTAVKITQCKQGECPVHGESCDCTPDEHRYLILEERDAAGRGDSSRFLAAGATRSLWVRVRSGQRGAAWPELRGELADAAHVIIESNSILDFVAPDLYLLVLDPGREDFKESARRNLAHADAIILHQTDAVPVWSDHSQSWLAGKLKFFLPPGRTSSPELLDLVRSRIVAASLRT